MFHLFCSEIVVPLIVGPVLLILVVYGKISHLLLWLPIEKFVPVGIGSHLGVGGLLMKELLAHGFESEGDGHEEDHAEGGEHLCDSVAQEDVNPADLHLQVALDAWFGIGECVHYDTQANMQHDNHLYHEEMAICLLGDRLHVILKFRV